ncbi:FtsH protease activity modulator HflK [Herminiimonas sp. CN]|uniref:FtsH protease activity modulator HflK n=1 Tax=Herminiimonas sp. CN TaxID=1349818 RepID=UPI0004730E34|nr:FtsH protease activity modulator HflK [Herminiimonas sp. CN]
MPVSILKKIRLMFSLNDPRWGRDSRGDENKNHMQNDKNPNNGPPDLDQLWRDFNQRLNRFFGGKSGGSSSGSNGDSFKPDAKGAGIGVGVIAAIAISLWLVSGFFIVQEGQTGIVMTFGKYKSMAPAGFNWRWPSPIQSHEIVNVSQVRTVEVGYRSSVKNKQPKEALMLTDDENIIDIQFAVQYKLKNASDWIFNNRDQEELIRQVAETSIREIVGKNKMDFVLYEGREKVAFDVAQLMQNIVDRYKSGAQITNVTMQGVQPPEQVQASFDDAVKAGQDLVRQKNEGQAYANDVIPKARGAVSRLMQEAEAYRSRVEANALGDASRFNQIYAEYQKAPAVTRDRIYLDTMQYIFTNTTKLMVDVKNGNSLLYLPLDKLMAQTSASGIPAANQNSASNAVPGSALDSLPSSGSLQQKDSRSRESRDSRGQETR